jgi:putative ABC transport system ATP-binding protein
MIRLIDVHKDYAAPRVHGRASSSEAVHALRHINLSVSQGEFVAVVGPSGCGKSTLLHITGGLDKPTEGEAIVLDSKLHAMGERELSLFRKKHLGVVFQFFNLLPQLTALENVMIPLRLQKVAFAEAEKRSSEILGQVGLGDKADRLPAELSGGEQQRVAIARAVVHRPNLLLADEPTGNLDSKTSANVLDVLQQLRREHTLTVLLVTHSEDVASSADRRIVMQDGRILA